MRSKFEDRESHLLGGLLGGFGKSPQSSPLYNAAKGYINDQAELKKLRKQKAAQQPAAAPAMKKGGRSYKSNGG